MHRQFITSQQGIGLIEVLIALVVVSLGLLGLAKFEGSLLNTSGNNKARMEAIGIAQQQIETIRYEASSKVAYEGLNDAGSPIDLNPFVVTGTNAQFTVDIDIEDPDANSLINTIVDVSWTAANGTADSVTLMSEIALQDIQKSALNTNDSAASTAVPSPRQSASEDVRPASENVSDPSVISPTQTPLPARGTVAEDTNRASTLAASFTVNDVNDSSISYLLTAIAEDSRYYITAFGDGVLGVYVCESTETNGCRYIQNHFGGVTLSTAGKIYATHPTIAQANNLSAITPVWSSSEVTACYKGQILTPTQTGGQYYEVAYECVYAGNCSDEPNDGDYCQLGVTPEQVKEKNVGPGGEFGNLGLIGLDGMVNGDQVCFLEDTASSSSTAVSGTQITADTQSENVLNGKYQGGGSKNQYNENYLFPVTARSYITRRLMSNGEERSEGINKSFRNHNFLLVDRANNADTYKNCYEAVNKSLTTLGKFVLAPRNIVRVRTDTNSPVKNPVEPVSVFNGTMPAVTVKSTVSGARPNLYIPEIGSCYTKTTNDNFACVIPSNYTNGVTIYGKSGNFPTPDPNIDPAIPVAFRTCTFDVDPSEVGNIDSPEATPLFDCRWPTDF